MALGLCFPARRTTGCISANNCIKPNGNIFAVHEEIPLSEIWNTSNSNQSHTVLMIQLGFRGESEQLVTLNKRLIFRYFIESHFYVKISILKVHLYLIRNRFELFVVSQLPTYSQPTLHSYFLLCKSHK